MTLTYRTEPDLYGSNQLSSISGTEFGDTGSSMSLLECLVRLLGEESRVLSSSAEAELITGLLAMLTQPLDGIPDSPIESDSGPQQAKEGTVAEDQVKSPAPALANPTLKGRITNGINYVDHLTSIATQLLRSLLRSQ